MNTIPLFSNVLRGFVFDKRDQFAHTAIVTSLVAPFADVDKSSIVSVGLKWQWVSLCVKEGGPTETWFPVQQCTTRMELIWCQTHLCPHSMNMPFCLKRGEREREWQRCFHNETIMKLNCNWPTIQLNWTLALQKINAKVYTTTSKQTRKISRPHTPQTNQVLTSLPIWKQPKTNSFVLKTTEISWVPINELTKTNTWHHLP